MNFFLKFIISTMLVLFSLSEAYSESKSFLAQVRELEKSGDDLGIRILVRKNFKKKLSVKDWFEVRKLLMKRPKVGFDAITAWDRQISLKATSLEKESDKIFQFLDKADEYSLNKEYEKSFEMYQRAAKYFKTSNKGRIPKGNQQLYLNIIHQMARSLYGQKRFNEALEVYDWISPVYPQIRQVLFEKMWTSFRAGKYDVALGTIASQQSGYFSEYLHPESYLIKIYIFKRLCRKKDINYTVDAIKKYLSVLKNGKFTYLEWAKTDLYYMSLAQLIESGQTKVDSNSYINEKDRLDEIKKIQESLKERFKVQKEVLQAQLERVYGYATLALGNDQEVLKGLESLPDSKVIEKKSYIAWPASDAEEWLDEIGSHVYIGKSECQSATLNNENNKDKKE